jgi:hypothetical protein
MKMEQTQCSETSAIKHHTPENNQKDYTQPSNKFGRNPFKSHRGYEAVSTDTIVVEWRALRLAPLCLLLLFCPDILAYVNKSKALALAKAIMWLTLPVTV